MNEYDSAKMADLLSTKHGMTPINAPSEADMIVLNTCSIRENTRKSFLTTWEMEIL